MNTYNNKLKIFTYIYTMMNERKEDEITNDLNGKKRCRLKQEKECIVAKRAKMNIEEEVRVQNEKDKERIKMLEVDDCNRNEQEKASIGMNKYLSPP